ncbi:hypothetical protein NE452_16425 [Paeniclostridium sordellii]|uniref:hypothetical protein n=1 Tax=Paraclostridium sordellii TaxID=1505 RepID=UPI002108DD70|nr:hypothetical protein [Paeniclostridium sordellii]MCQ4699113.1 hypothetical protein [Paeniclostridium sordellii]
MEKFRKVLSTFIKSGSEITGAVINTSINTTMPGFEGVILGTAVQQIFTKVGEEINNQLLSPREVKRVGATATYIVQKINEELNRGKELRSDDFFDDNKSNRSDAEEILEGIFLKAQKEHEEKKLKYYGNLIANICFNETVSKDFANQLINIVDKLTYRQLQLIVVYSLNKMQSKSFLRDGKFTDLSGKEIDKISILQDTIELYRMSILNCGGEMFLEMSQINPSKMGLDPLGAWLAKLMNLGEIGNEDYREVDKIVMILQ